MIVTKDEDFESTGFCTRVLRLPGSESDTIKQRIDTAFAGLEAAKAEAEGRPRGRMSTTLSTEVIALA